MKNSAYKKKIHSSLGGVVLLLSISSIFSIGFSSWNIGGNPIASANIDIVADDVSTNSSYFLFNESAATIDDETATNPPVPFSYNDYGVVKDGVVTSEGSFAFFLAVLLRGENGIYKSNESLTAFGFNLEATSTGVNLLAYLKDVTYLINSNGSFKALVSKNEDNTHIGLTCENASYLAEERLFFRISLNFDFSDVNNFKTAIANNMVSTSLNFKVIFGD